MGLSEIRGWFFKNRENCEILVKSHAFKDYPERGFSQSEIIELVKRGNGRLIENDSPKAIEGSCLFHTKDERDRACKLVVLIELIEIEGEGISKEKRIIVCSAYREIL